MPGRRLGSMCVKTKMCRFFLMDTCHKGEDCCFAHTKEELQSAPDLSRTKLCPVLINTGECRDPSCLFAHGKGDLRKVVLDKTANPQASLKQVNPPATAPPPASSPAPPPAPVPAPVQLCLGAVLDATAARRTARPAVADKRGDRDDLVEFPFKLNTRLSSSRFFSSGGISSVSNVSTCMNSSQDDLASQWGPSPLSEASDTVDVDGVGSPPETPCMINISAAMAAVSSAAAAARAQVAATAARVAPQGVPDAPPAATGSRNKFHKTKMCQFFLAGKCRKRMSCNFAHSEVEVNPLPDLRCTKLCPLVTAGQPCIDPKCAFAHRGEELRVTEKTNRESSGPFLKLDEIDFDEELDEDSSPGSDFLPFTRTISDGARSAAPEGTSVVVKNTFVTLEPDEDDEETQPAPRRARSAPGRVAVASNLEPTAAVGGRREPASPGQRATRVGARTRTLPLFSTLLTEAVGKEPALEEPKASNEPKHLEESSQRPSSPPPRAKTVRFAPLPVPSLPTLLGQPSVGSLPALGDAGSFGAFKGIAEITCFPNVVWARTSSV